MPVHVVRTVRPIPAVRLIPTAYVTGYRVRLMTLIEEAAEFFVGGYRAFVFLRSLSGSTGRIGSHTVTLYVVVFPADATSISSGTEQPGLIRIDTIV